MDSIDYDLINIFVDLGFGVLYIEKEYWITNSWIPSDSKAFFKHHLVGIRLSDSIRNRITSKPNELNNIISTTIPMQVYYSSNINWRHYVK